MAADLKAIQVLCSKASDSALYKGDAQAKATLRASMAKREQYQRSLMAGCPETCVDFQIDGIWYTLAVHEARGKYGKELWVVGRNWEKSPEVKTQENEDKAAAQRARLGRMFANAQ